MNKGFLKIKSRGGCGSKGQDGGDGKEGKPGSDGVSGYKYLKPDSTSEKEENKTYNENKSKLNSNIDSSRYNNEWS